jgi:hypothetical protein
MKAVNTCNLSQTVLFYVKLLNKKSIQILDSVNRVSVKWQYLQAAISLKTLDLLNIIAVKDECLEIDILVCSLNFVDQVSRIINIFEVGRRLEIKCLSDLIPWGIQLDHVFKVREIFQVDKLIVWDVNNLQVLELINALNGDFYSI